MLSTHLTVLEASALRSPSAVAFKIPQSGTSPHEKTIWRDITYGQFLSEVELFARHWSRTFQEAGIPQRSVVGLWIGGYRYEDILNIYGVSRAGYIPQLFSLRLPNADVILELLTKTQARALIYEDLFEPALRSWPLPVYRAAERDSIQVVGSSDLALSPIFVGQNHETAFYFHTSGSTSGIPKLVPCSYRWLDMTVRKAHQICAPRSDRVDVAVWGGSMCHIFQNFLLIGYLQHNAGMIQPVANPFTSEQLLGMIQDCQLNRLNIFASFLANHLRASRSDPNLLKMLASVDEIIYSGLALPREEEAYAYSQGIKLRSVFGSTEVGAMLVSIGGCETNAPFLRPTDGVLYKFVPLEATPSSAPHVSTARLLELIIPAESDDCPDVSLRHPDGDFHTGDLFSSPSPGCYMFEGRNDDWIKSEGGLRCNTKAIEDNARAMCGTLISECVVVGTGRPSPVLFVERGLSAMGDAKLKVEIIRKTRQFHSRRYLHERLASAESVVVVPSGSLPRTATKGNIRRQAVEEMYRSEIDRIFSR